MKFGRVMDLMKKYSVCPKCGSDKVGNGKGSLLVKAESFHRSCSCGWGVTVEE